MTIEREIQIASERAEKENRLKSLAEITPFVSPGAQPRKFRGVTTYRLDNAHIDGRRYFAYVIGEFEKAKTEAQNGIPFKFEWSEPQLEVIRGLIRHAINDDTGPYPVFKGWYLWGDVQIGKTTLARAVQHLHAVISQHQKKSTDKYFKISDVRKMYRDFRETERPTTTHYTFDDRLFDDVGAPEEITGIKVFGEQRDPMAEILWERHGKWSRSGLLTYATSNLPFEDVTDANGKVLFAGWINRFEERLQMRLREMFTPVFFPVNENLIRNHG